MSPAVCENLSFLSQYAAHGMVNYCSHFPQRAHTLLQMQIVINNIIDIVYLLSKKQNRSWGYVGDDAKNGK